MSVSGSGSPRSSWCLRNRINSSGSGHPISVSLQRRHTVLSFMVSAVYRGQAFCAKLRRRLHANFSSGSLCLGGAGRQNGLSAMGSLTMVPVPCVVKHRNQFAHLLISCVFSRETWFRLFSKDHLQRVTPSPDSTWPDWWLWSRKQLTVAKRKAFDAVVVLTCWCLWRENATHASSMAASSKCQN
jgi:hypothetical protein